MSSSSSTSSELIFSQLRSVGIAVNPQWDISTLTSDVIYGLCYDASKVTVIPPLESADPTGAKRRAFEAIRTADNDLLQLFADKGLPGRLPMSMRDRFSTCQTLCDAMRLALGVETDYTAIMYPDAPKTKQLLQAVARAVGEHADALAAAIAEAEDANTTGHDDAEDEVPTAASATKRGMALLRRMCEQFTPATATFRVADATWTPGTAECQPVVAFEAVELTPAGDDGETTLLMSCPSQRQALPSLVEFVAAQRVGTKPFESLRKRRLTRDAVKKSGATAQSSRNAASVAPPLAPEQLKTCDSLFFGTALALDPTVAEQRRIEAEELAAAQQAHNEDVEALESEVAQQKEQREADEETIEAKISEVKSQIAEYKALAKAAKAAIKQHQRTIEELDENREASTADRARRQQLAEELQNLIVEAANPATLEALTAKYEALVAERETQRAEFESKLSKTVKKLTKLKAMAELNKGDQSEAVAVLKAECKHLRKSIRMSHVEAANLARDWDRCPKEVDRSKYARLVTDMSSSLRRQQTQIDGVTAEQRESMAACGKVRAETKVVFDEVEAHVYDHAKREAFAKDAYAGIIKLREAYTSLVSAIERRGEIKREQHVLDARHAKLVKSVQYFEEADASINEDLNTIRAEIQELQSKIKDWQHAAAATPADE